MNQSDRARAQGAFTQMQEAMFGPSRPEPFMHRLIQNTIQLSLLCVTLGIVFGVVVGCYALFTVVFG